jgi:hypothetical protein
VESCRQAAVQARELAAFARSRPAVLTTVSEWAVDEVMAAFALSARAAGRLLAGAVHPGGETITTYPPRFGVDDDPVRREPSPERQRVTATVHSPLDPPLTADERVLGRLPAHGATDVDPAPF